MTNLPPRFDAPVLDSDLSFDNALPPRFDAVNVIKKKNDTTTGESIDLSLGNIPPAFNSHSIVNTTTHQRFSESLLSIREKLTHSAKSKGFDIS